MHWLFVGPTRVLVVQFYLLLSPYLCFISFLYLELYVLGDDILISYGYFMQSTYLWVFIHIWTKGEVGAPLNRLKPSSKIVYWPFQGSTSFEDTLCFFCRVFAMHLYVYMCLVVTWFERADLSWLSFVVSSCEFVTFPLLSWARYGTWLYEGHPISSDNDPIKQNLFL